MKLKKSHAILAVPVLIVIGLVSCKYYVDHSFRQTYTEYNEEIHQDTSNIPFFKVHFHNGDVGVMDQWALSEGKDSLLGTGKLYDFNRYQLIEGQLAFSLTDVANIENNELETIKSKDGDRIAALSIMSGANIGLGIFCIVNPKACFGSCPTFYIDGPQSLHFARAEGFSSANAPALEAGDVDALAHSAPARPFTITMKNEALETHLVNQVSLLAIPKQKGQTVFHSPDDRYYLSSGEYAPILASSELNDIKLEISCMDEMEYYSFTDSFDLFTKEEIVLEFDQVPLDELGVVVHFRQSLLTTYLFYSSLSYMGDEIGEYFPKLGTEPVATRQFFELQERLGGISFFYWDAMRKAWVPFGEVLESGPIAQNLKILPLPEKLKLNKGLRLKMEMNRGLWRLDYVGLTGIEAKVEPEAYLPFEGKDIDGELISTRNIAKDDEDYLATFPEQAYTFNFILPDIPDEKKL